MTGAAGHGPGRLGPLDTARDDWGCWTRPGMTGQSCSPRCRCLGAVGGGEVKRKDTTFPMG